MGKGIALQFKTAFPANYSAYEKACAKGEVTTGRMFVFDRGTPPLGCGNGGLNWVDVKPLIAKAFAALPEIRVLLFAPGDTPLPETMPNKTKRPRMTAGRAAIVGIMSRYQGFGQDYRLAMLEVQKLAYFLQVAGERLKLEFVKGEYGPYADELRKVLRHIEGHFIIGFGDGNNAPETSIEVKKDAIVEAEEFLQTAEKTKTRFERVALLIEGFETPYGMELLSTVHWTATHADLSPDDFQGLVGSVDSWNDRKKELMRAEHFKAAWRRLKEQRWL
jgi:O-acetyl-ADP-ribose deacetylase (regulator of RNase III)